MTTRSRLRRYHGSIGPGPFLATVALALSLAPVSASAGGVGMGVHVLQREQDRTVIRYELGDYVVNPVTIAGAKYAHIVLPGEPQSHRKGAPELPRVSRSIVIPDDAAMTINVLSDKHHDVSDIDIAPSKGHILRTVSPRDVPYFFGDAYRANAFYPDAPVALGEPYILRDYRGVVVTFNPFRYNPVTRTLRVYTEITLEVVRTGPGLVNVPSRAVRRARRGASAVFRRIYNSQFLNYAPQEGNSPQNETGDLLIIAHDPWLGNVQPLVDHKQARGIPTTAIGVSTIPGGNNATAIKNYIQDVYDSSDLAFVLLVGDSVEVATPYAVGGAADPTYALLSGSDHYPDILVGRFSAQTAADVDTQVLRTMEYEMLPATAQEWFKKGVGIASDEGPGDDGEYDYEHIENIRLDLLAYGYTLVDQIYDPGATAAQLTAALNAGRGIINYAGHGSVTTWGTTRFSMSDVNSLVNYNMLPFIIDVGCVNGAFDGPTCFAEAWMRATHSGEPTGAIGIYASSIDQYWDPPMAAQDEAVDLLVAEEYITYGALCFAGSCLMMDEYESVGRDMFDTWHVFGDPSLRVLSRCSDQGGITLDRSAYACEGLANITVQDCGLDADSGVADTVTVTIDSDSEPGGEDVLLTETGLATAVFAGSIQLSMNDAAAVLYVASGDTVIATYVDVDGGPDGGNVHVTDIAVVDCQPPVIFDVRTTEIGTRSATVAFDTDDLAEGTVRYGPTCTGLTKTATESEQLASHLVRLTELTVSTTYFYAVEATDEAGNQAVDDRDGLCYSFTTPESIDYFTEQFASGDNDLGYSTIVFTPDAVPDYYTACSHSINRLPSDPEGGTSLNLWDDTWEAITLSGDATVRLYGDSYNIIYVGSNGYVTFDAGDTDYVESLEDHFSLPRIAALFDDLNPAGGGTISWKQLEDRAVVTWQNLPEYGSSSGNTFQIEMYFDGRITISCLALAATDGLVGLSRGGGLPVDFSESDLSGVGYCAIPGDFDHDGDVDSDDSDQFELCFTGSGGRPLDQECLPGDFDGDDDIDCEDWELFKLAWTDSVDPPAFPPCSTECGNGVLEPGELCDLSIPDGQPGACPTGCDTGDPCDIGTLLDSGTCLAQCDFLIITELINGDGCCPVGANAINDEDCSPVCGNGVCEIGEDVECLSDCQCTDDSECSDDYVCTFDRCIDGMCSHTPSRYGDVDHNDVFNVFDMFCIMRGFAGDFSEVSFQDTDIHPCGGDDIINVFDLFAVMNSFGGTDPCCGTLP